MMNAVQRARAGDRRRIGWSTTCAAAVGLMAAAPLAAQTTWHVAAPGAGGNDGYAGTAAAPFATIQRAVNVVQPGDSVLIGPGAFAGFNVGGGSTAEGTSSAPISFRGTRGPAGQWLTVIDTEAPRFNGTTHHARINIDTASWITIEDLEVVGIADQRASKAGIRAVMPPSGTDGYITVRRCHIHHNGEWGVFTGHVHHVTVEDCLIHHQFDEHGVYLSNSGDGHIVRGNTIHSNSSNGLHVNSDASQGGDGVITNVLVEQNTFYSNGGGSTYIDGAGVTRTSAGGGSAVNFDGVNDSWIRSNVMYDNRASGISLYRIDGAVGARNNTVAGNTIINASTGRWCVNIQNASTGNRIIANILLNYHSFRGSVIATADSLPMLQSDYNIVMDRMDPGVGSPQTLAQWRAATGQDAHSLALPAAAWPGLFVSLPAWDLHLTSTSAARNLGGLVTFPGLGPFVDRDGVARPAEGLLDAGGYEFSPATPVCPADFNGAGGVTVQDIFDFLAAYFAGDLRADFDGAGGVTVQDIFDFLAAYFLPCP